MAEKEQRSLQYEQEAKYYLDQLPENTRKWLSYYAYEQGHSSGEDEVNSYISSIGYELVTALKSDNLI